MSKIEKTTAGDDWQRVEVIIEVVHSASGETIQLTRVDLDNMVATLTRANDLSKKIAALTSATVDRETFKEFMEEHEWDGKDFKVIPQR
jgi:hypothetical protein